MKPNNPQIITQMVPGVTVQNIQFPNGGNRPMQNVAIQNIPIQVRGLPLQIMSNNNMNNTMNCNVNGNQRPISMMLPKPNQTTIINPGVQMMNQPNIMATNVQLNGQPNIVNAQANNQPNVIQGNVRGNGNGIILGKIQQLQTIVPFQGRFVQQPMQLPKQEQQNNVNTAANTQGRPLMFNNTMNMRNPGQLQMQVPMNGQNGVVSYIRTVGPNTAGQNVLGGIQFMPQNLNVMTQTQKKENIQAQQNGVPMNVLQLQQPMFVQAQPQIAMNCTKSQMTNNVMPQYHSQFQTKLDMNPRIVQQQQSTNTNQKPKKVAQNKSTSDLASVASNKSKSLKKPTKSREVIEPKNKMFTEINKLIKDALDENQKAYDDSIKKHPQYSDEFEKVLKQISTFCNKNQFFGYICENDKVIIKIPSCESKDPRLNIHFSVNDKKDEKWGFCRPFTSDNKVLQDDLIDKNMKISPSIEKFFDEYFVC